MPQLVADHRRLVRRRLAATLSGLLLFLAVLAGRLVQLQVVQGSRLQDLAARQQLETIVLGPRRGRILDRRGRPLAVTVDAPSLYAVPSAIPDLAAFARRVAPLVGQPPAEIERRLRAGRHFAWLARKVDPEVVSRVRSAVGAEQVGILTEQRRSYPNGRLGAHVLGFAGIDNQGLAGVELSYDAILRGTAGRAVAARDGLGRILVETQRVQVAPREGQEVLLTIDQVLQHIAERELAAAVRRYESHGGWVVVLDPRTGEVLALASSPGFDPNAGADADPDRWRNRAISDAHEPGSTFKIFVIAAALDAGAVTPGQSFLCTGQLAAPGGVILRDAGGQRHGWVSPADIIRYSCNIGAAQVGTLLGRERLYHYIRAFGFGRPVGIDLPGESGGIVPPPERWLGPGLQTISFGQGLSVTAMQLAAAATALANEGVMLRPFVARAIREVDGRLVRVVGRHPVRRVVRPEVAAQVLRMMVGTTESGTGTEARIPGYQVAGKTATAQKAAAGGGYDPARVVASFLGLVPASRPRLLILVGLDEPRRASSGGEAAAPVFREIASQALWYLRIPPTEPPPDGP
ncbi:MAG: penicillin-binding protein 2 [Armatimonadota bacterium]|nr:penicillin-binding protein 2 [Armatimonadota bacterium]MDR7404049.1 penicillin-binding protein 2 [Armatimonadota bacterium]MDR7508809.1 penicillin-binding protein 2 [Armatimonadota bacterium]MDR7517844.1 penicillin-binding protein 2 [Armatimonadota bacterium]MDR7561285.1 penicillin-binding protein 2 [Armatimonadota bacterium]